MTARRRPGAQRGVALITALLIVALATVAAVAMMSEEQIGVARTENLLDSEQAYLYALGAEDWVVGLLARNAPGSGDSALPENRRATVLRPSLAVRGAKLVATVEDMQARLNLNDLVQNGRPDPRSIARFRRLLDGLHLDPGLADAVVDWIDADQIPFSANGAEDDFYLRRKPAYRTADAPLASTSELRLVRGFSTSAVEALAPYVAALPEPTPINVNTAPPEVLMTLGDGIGASDAGRIVQDRGTQGFASLDAFDGDPVISARPGADRAVTLASAYFKVTTEVTYRRGRARLTSLLHRNDRGEVQVLMRSLGTD